MSVKGIIPLVCIGVVLGAPFLFKERSTTLSKEMLQQGQSKQVINKEFTVKVNDINKSNNGFITCTYYLIDVQEELIGPCNTTGDKDLVVGRTYTVKKATVDKDFIVIHDAKLIAGMNRKRVVRVFNKGWTRLAELDDGSIIGGDNLRVDDWVSVE